MREKIQVDSAEWRIEHYDRSPDSLFGDDVKSRNCIVFRLKGEDKNQKYVTGLLRWTSKARDKILSKPKSMVDIAGHPISEYIPKLNTTIERDAFLRLIYTNSSLFQHLYAVPKKDDAQIFVKGTAYNWICAYDHLPPCENRDGDIYISKELKFFATKTENDVYFALAILNSIFSFWLWTVVGDGFHVTNRFLSSLCLGAERFTGQQYAEVVSIGKSFCENIIKFPSYSINNGKVITNYDHKPLLAQAGEIDKLISTAISLPDDFPKYLHNWYSNIVSCGRSPEMAK